MGTIELIPAIAASKVARTLPTDLTGLFGWWDLTDATKLFTDAGSTNVTTDGDIIYQINDKSGNAHHLVQTTLGRRATYKTNVIAGYSIGRLAGAAACGYVATITEQNQPTTLIAVAKQTSKATSARYFDIQGGGGRNLMGLDTSGFEEIYAGSVISGAVDRSGSFHIVSVVINGASSKGYCDGVLDVSGNAGASTTGSQISLGSDTVNPGLNGDVVEAVMVNGAIGTDQHNSIGRSYAAHYGLTWTTVT